MYSRNYFDSDKESFALPQNYDGTAFAEEEKSDESATRPPDNDEIKVDSEPYLAAGGEAIKEASSPLGFLSGLGKNLFGGLFGGRLKFPSIGTEEILIIATAMFLLFSKDGDTECAILLLLLLLIN